MGCLYSPRTLSRDTHLDRVEQEQPRRARPPEQWLHRAGSLSLVRLDRRQVEARPKLLPHSSSLEPTFRLVGHQRAIPQEVGANQARFKR